MEEDLQWHTGSGTGETNDAVFQIHVCTFYTVKVCKDAS